MRGGREREEADLPLLQPDDDDDGDDDDDDDVMVK